MMTILLGLSLYTIPTHLVKMKKLIIGTSFLVFASAAIAEEAKLEWPKVEYPTALIGQFMGFCQQTLNAAAAYHDRESFKNNQSGHMAASSNICGCIIDSYRENNSEFTFRIEFEARTSNLVPYFKKYLDECKTLHNNLQIFNSGA